MTHPTVEVQGEEIVLTWPAGFKLRLNADAIDAISTAVIDVRTARDKRVGAEKLERRREEARAHSDREWTACQLKLSQLREKYDAFLDEHPSVLHKMGGIEIRSLNQGQVAFTSGQPSLYETLQSNPNDWGLPYDEQVPTTRFWVNSPDFGVVRKIEFIKKYGWFEPLWVKGEKRWHLASHRPKKFVEMSESMPDDSMSICAKCLVQYFRGKQNE